MHLLRKMIPAGFKPAVLKAEQLINDVTKVTSLLKKAASRAEKNKPLLKEVWDGLTTLFRLLNEYISGR